MEADDEIYWSGSMAERRRRQSSNGAGPSQHSEVEDHGTVSKSRYIVAVQQHSVSQRLSNTYCLPGSYIALTMREFTSRRSSHQDEMRSLITCGTLSIDGAVVVM
uniref:Uncharacterized protein n=1 Tax=Anopheles culicifacies TaxID=139723 RepID=A0A182MFU9_9DIPT